MDNSILMWMMLVPAIAGVTAFVCPKRAVWLVHLLTIAVAGWLVFTSYRLFDQFEMGWEWPWLKLGSVTLSVEALVTRFGSVISLLVSIFGLLLAIYCVAFTRNSVSRHNAYMLWTLAGGIGAALANNLFFLLICWELTTLMLYLMIGLGGEKAKAGAAKTFAILGFSDCAMLLAIILLMFAVANPTLTMNEMHNIPTDSPLRILCYLLLLVAALAKAGAMPFHTWIPTAAENAPTDVMAFLPASLDKLLGIYLLTRISVEFFTLAAPLKWLLMIIGVVTIVGAVMMAMIQHDLKKLLSFHAISQVGYMVLGIGTGSVLGVAGGVFHMINHAIYKSCLFLTAGSVEKQAKTTDLDALGGLARLMPLSFIACVLSALAISGVPPMNGFTSKLMIYQACIDLPSRVGPFLVAAAIFGSALTLASFVKVIHGVFLGKLSVDLTQSKPKESPFWMTLPMLILGVTCIIFGVVTALPLGSLVTPALQTLGLKETFEPGWNAGLATLLLTLAFIIGLVILAVGKGFRARRSANYIGGEQLPVGSHYSGTAFYTTIRSLPVIRAVLNDAERESFDVYRINGRLGGAFVEALRRFQTGVLPLYISWVLLGLVLIVAYLMGSNTSPL